MKDVVAFPVVTPPQSGSARTKTIVQRLLFPDPGVNSEPELFFHNSGAYVGFDTQKRAYYALKGAVIRFDSYFNAFPVHLYDLEENSLSIVLKAEGQFIIKVVLARHGKSWEQLFEANLRLSEGEETVVELPEAQLDGVIYVEIITITKTTIYSLDYCVDGLLKRDASITGVITTFKRDAAVQKTGRRLQEYFEKNPDVAPFFKLLVIDNGGDTDSVPFSQGQVIKNKNLGGAGGFTRGMLEVSEKQLSSHVLFMDDDASFFPESIRRTLSLLRFSREPKLAIAGAMIADNHRWRMWENAATFNLRCRPINHGADLRDFGQVRQISMTQPRGIPNKYGGWWYFCFPLSEAKVWPFPFFVRGDDSYFSISNEFDIVTMLGVVAHQEDFFSKQTPLVVYLDTRYHLVHHLTFPGLKLDWKSYWKMISRYFHRFNNSYHYESAAAINQALADVMSGEEFWEQNVDMSVRREYFKEVIKQEKIQENLMFNQGGVTPHAPKRSTKKLAVFLRNISFNGHLLPGSMFYKKGVQFPLNVRAVEHDTFRRPYTVTVDPDSGKGYICRLNRQAYFANLRRFLELKREFRKSYDSLRKQYAGATETLTVKDAWKRRFDEETTVLQASVPGKLFN